MPKPAKKRCVQSPPGVLCFKPTGIPMRALEQVALTLGEYEALRLVDGEGMDHEAAAAKLGVSRPTCARMMESAHKKVADALTCGKALYIEGGEYRLCMNRYRCNDCGTLWEAQFRKGGKPETVTCGSCGSSNVTDMGEQLGWQPDGGGCGGRGRGGAGRGRCGR